MRRLFSIFLGAALILSFCFIITGYGQESKDTEGRYTIQQGDTLWDISSKFLKDPYLWPKIWENNPYITNPDLIYPGNQINLSATVPSPKEEPKKAVEEKPQEVIEEKTQKEAEVKEPAVGKPEAEKVETEKAEAGKEEVPPPAPVEKEEEVTAEAKPETKPEVKVEEAPVPEEEKPPYFSEVRSSGFMSDIDYPGIGLVIESREGKNYMSEGDIVYLTIKTSEPVRIGNKYTIFRAGRQIRHPLTSKIIGRRYNIVGNAQIIDQNGKFYVAKVLEAFDAVMMGDRIQVYSPEKMESRSEE